MKKINSSSLVWNKVILEAMDDGMLGLLGLHLVYLRSDPQQELSISVTYLVVYFIFG